MAKKAAVVAAAAAAVAAIDLAEIVNATKAGSFLYVDEAAAAEYVSNGLIEINNTMRNPENPAQVAARATSEGISSMDATTSTAPQAAPISAADYGIVISAPLERAKRGGGGRSRKYPFEHLPAPDPQGNTAKFFIPATEKQPEPWRSLSATVSAASRRFADITGTKPGKNSKGEDIERNIYHYNRRFSIIEGENNGVKGAWIERVV